MPHDCVNWEVGYSAVNVVYDKPKKSIRLYPPEIGSVQVAVSFLFLIFQQNKLVVFEASHV